jgi:protein-arginine deiminase
MTPRSWLRCGACVLLVASQGCGEEDETTVVPAQPPAPDHIDFIADTNRDGVFDRTDNEGEELWTISAGAAFLPNLDDDDNDGIIDADDAFVNVTPERTGDAFDLAPVFVFAWAEVPETAVGRVALDLAAVPHVRMFKHLGDSLFELVAGANACDMGPEGCDPAVIELTAEEIRAGVELRVEGLHLVGTPPAVNEDGSAWSGLLDLSYQILDEEGSAITMPGNPEGIDVIQMRVAPWIMFGNLTPNLDLIMANNASGVFMSGITDATEAADVPFWTITSWPTDHWTEDYFQTGFASVPWADDKVHGMRLAMPRPWGRDLGSLPVNFLLNDMTAADSGSFVVYLEPDTGSTYDSHGNHDLIPSYSHNGQDFPYGRIVHGSNVLPETRAFYDAQLVQGPALEVHTSWLIVGHIDEVFSYVPAGTERGWKLLVASPSLARDMLLDWQAEGFGDTPMFLDRRWFNGNDATITIDEVLADTQLMSASQRAQGFIDGMVATMIEQVGLSDDEIVEIPFLFEQEAGQLVAFNPGTVNALVFGNRMVAPDPFGPMIKGVDGFKQDLIDRLASDVHQLGELGQGLDLSFTDDWDLYHRLLGEVHCGTNISGPPQPEIRWWEAMQ